MVFPKDKDPYAIYPDLLKQAGEARFPAQTAPSNAPPSRAPQAPRPNLPPAAAAAASPAVQQAVEAEKLNAIFAKVVNPALA